MYDHFIKNNLKCVVTFIDFADAFTSTSHKFIDQTLKKAKASRKTRALFRAIYKAAFDTVKLNGTDGKLSFSRTFDIARGVVQGDIINPVFLLSP